MLGEEKSKCVGRVGPLPALIRDLRSANYLPYHLRQQTIWHADSVFVITVMTIIIILIMTVVMVIVLSHTSGGSGSPPASCLKITNLLRTSSCQE